MCFTPSDISTLSPAPDEPVGGGPTEPDFTLPDANVATVPPEYRGLARDQIRLLVTSADDQTQHRRFRALPDLLAPDDLLVVNRSRTIPAALPALRADGRDAVVHLAHHIDGELWAVEIREQKGWGTGPQFDAAPGEPLQLAGDSRMTLLAPYRQPIATAGPDRLWLANWRTPIPPLAYLERHAGPIRYDYITEDVPMEMYRTIFGTEPGSSEMPSAARGFSDRLVADLESRGIDIAHITLHTGVSSLEADERPYPEQFRVPTATVDAIARTRRTGGRVIAVGTTVIRALESAVSDAGLQPARGWTGRVIEPDDDLQTVDGLLTGLHTPQSSHLKMLRALMPHRLLLAAYRDAIERGYLWHEFGDAHLLV